MGKTSEVSFRLITLILLQYLIDLLYTFVYGTVNPIRAALIGITALILLSVQYFAYNKFIDPIIGALSIYSSALFGTLLVQNHYLISKSFLLYLVYLIILIITYLLINYLVSLYKRFKS